MRVTTHAVKCAVVDTCVRWLTMAGCTVGRMDSGELVTLSIKVPEDPKDIHGARLQAALEASGPSWQELARTT